MYNTQTEITQWTIAPLQITMNQTLNAPPEAIFQTLSDPEMMCNLFSWMDSVAIASPAASNTTTVGSLRTCILGNGLILEEEIIDWQPPYGYAFRGIDATHPFGMRGHVGVLSFTPTECGCLFTWQQYFDHSNVPVMRQHLTQNMEAAIDTLKQSFGSCSVSKIN
ncbi:MAG: SRPBCC family protein [Chloroflexota bacterium]